MTIDAVILSVLAVGYFVAGWTMAMFFAVTVNENPNRFSARLGLLLSLIIHICSIALFVLATIEVAS